MTKISSSTVLLLFLSIFSMYQSILSHPKIHKNDFTVELIHRDLQESMLYQPNQSPFERFAAAVNRSLIRSQLFSPKKHLTAAHTDLSSTGTGEFTMKIGIGTPPIDVYGFADTGSSLVWTQCEPCIKCFPQRNPLFKPMASSTYKNIAYYSTQCKSLSSIASPGDGGDACLYKVTYGDDYTFSKGNIAVETLVLGSHARLSIVFGCGHENDVATRRTSGVIGLDFGDGSLVSQLGPAINGVFSYCLSAFRSNRQSFITFGSDGFVPGPFTVYTPLTRKPNSNAYFLTLEAISVAGTRLAFPGSVFGGATEGNTIIDTGTTITFLPMSFYNQVAAEIEKVVKAEKVKVINMGLCYKGTQNDIALPPIKMHFKNADVNLSPSNSFVTASWKVMCLSFIGSPVNVAIYGNVVQSDFLIRYDRNAGTVSFSQHQCN